MSLSAPQVVTPAMVNALISKTVPPAFQATARQLYPSGTNVAEARTSYVAILTDAQFTSPVRRTAQCAAQNQTEPVWRYIFTHKHTISQLSVYGSYHGMELFYEFNNWENATLGQPFFFKPADDSVQQVMLKYWVNFANTGNPNGNELPSWPVYKSSEDGYLEIKATPDGTKRGLRSTQSDLWDDIAGFTGCTTSVGVKDRLIGIPFNIFPNPSSGIFRLNLPEGVTGFRVTVYNSSGQVCWQAKNQKEINLTRQQTGLYVVEVTTDGISYRKKVVKYG
jgi:para-nitrobenzyl esterase